MDKMVRRAVSREVDERAHDGDAGDASPTDGGDETSSDRLERELDQLLQELRSIVPGVQVMYAFLLTVAFTERFQSLTELQRDVYYALLLIGGLSLILLLAPSAFHRVRFRQRDKEAMIKAANVEVIAALVLISLSIAGVVFLISDLMFSTPIAVVVGVAVLFVSVVIWWGYPLARTAGDR